MSTQEILKKAIRKAIDGGWKPLWIGDITKFKLTSDLMSGVLLIAWLPRELSSTHINVPVLELIFNHDFAKALWGETVLVASGFYQTDGTYDDQDNLSFVGTEIVQDQSIEECIYLWQHHLQQMVIADDPIKYLGDNI